MRWEKQGLIYCPSGQNGWDKSYAHLPTVWNRPGKPPRVLFAALDESKFGRIGFVELSPSNLSEVIYISPQPILDLGEPGTFDDAGVNPACIIELSDRIFLYYIGWQRTANPRAPYMLFAGVAESLDGENFHRLSRTPILDRTEKEPFIRSAMTLLEDNGVFRCWYVSADRWITVNGSPYPEYVIRYAESKDGLSWKSFPNQTCIALKGDEFGIGRPWVLREFGIYKMWYSIRSHSAPYTIGYAESLDGLTWERMDSESHIPRSRSGWDSEMICYPCVTDISDKRVMFYNGNQHGLSGFGYALGSTE